MKTAHAAIVLCVLMALMVAVSWHMWLDPVVDSGREMNAPLRLLNGELLYSQVYYLYGPVAPLFNAALYGLFGSHLNTLYWAGIAGSLTLVFSIFFLGRRFMSPFEAMLSAVTVLAFCVFKESGNLIFPYSYAVLYGTLSATFALIAMVRHVCAGGRAGLFAAGLLSGLAFCCKAEFGLAVMAAAAALAITERRGRRLRFAAIFIPAFIIFPVLIGGFLFARVPPEYFFRDTFFFPGSIPDALVYFNRFILGFNNPGRTAREIISALAVLAGCSGLASLASFRLAGGSQKAKPGETGRPRRLLLVLTVSSWGLILLHLLIFGTRWDLNPFRALPLLFLAAICCCVVSLVRRRGEPASNRMLLVVAVYSLAVLARVVTRVPAGGGYGAGLLPVPLMLFTCMAVTDFLGFEVPSPAALFRRRAVSVFLAVVLAAVMGVFIFRYVDRETFAVEPPRGAFAVRPAVGRAVERTLEYIDRNSSPGEYILSLPEGSSLNFLADRPAPLRYEVMTPGFLDRREELEAVRVLQNRNVRLIFIINRPTSEFGAGVFGRDYCPS
jgi:MFS family permease